MFDIEEELKKLPARPGVYLMHDEKDAIIYVGKAISLKNRVRQYFQSSRSKGVKIDQMVTHISRFEYIVTDSELEALVLECNLIKEHRPKYNTMLMDDKTYPYIKVTVNEDYPRVLFSRQLKKDKAKYYGPYTSAGAVKDTIELIHKLYQIRTCSRNLPKDMGKERPCLNYHIKQCAAPCQGYISKEQYAENVGKALEFLNGNYGPLLKELEEKMKAASDAMEFEKAIEYRELLNSVKQIAQKQKITNSDMEDKDIIAMAVDGEDAVVQVFFIRDGRLIRYLPALDAKESPDFYHTLEDRVLLLTLIPGMGTEALAALEDSYQAVILQSFGVGGLPGGGSGPFAQAVERWLQAGKTIVMLTQVPYEGSDMAVYQVGYQVKEKYRLLEGYNMTLEAAVTKLMWVLGRTRDPEQVEALFYRPVQWDIIR